MIQGAEGRNSIIGLAIAIIALLITYWTCKGVLDEAFTQMGYVMMFTVIGSVFTIVLSATSITTEKETGSWPLLLSTTVGNLHVVAAKAAGVLRRTWVVWALLAAHVLLSVLFGVMHPVLMVLLPMVVVGAAVFLTGMGMFVSSLMRRSTAAVIICLGLVLAIWAVAPLIFGLVSEIDFAFDYLFEDLFAAMLYLNPVGETAVLIGGAGGDGTGTRH